MVPFVASMQPSERAKAAWRPRRGLSISRIEPGQKLDVEWRGKVVWIINRSQAMLDSLKTFDDKVADPEIEQQAAA